MKKKPYLILILAGLVFNSCGDTKINSTWRSQNITIDGNESDWGNSLIPSGDMDASIGILNDNSYLYICLTTSDPETEGKILMNGLTLWFQGSENINDKFGIHYPMGISDSNAAPPDQDIRPDRRTFNPSQIQENLLKTKTGLEIINTNGEKIRIPVSELKDIQIKMTLDKGKIVYELKMPLNQKNSKTYALNANTDGIVRLGIESGTTNRMGIIPPGGNFGMPGNGEEGPGGGPGGGPDGAGFPPPGGGMGREMFSSSPINFWINIKLATNK